MKFPQRIPETRSSQNSERVETDDILQTFPYERATTTEENECHSAIVGMSTIYSVRYRIDRLLEISSRHSDSSTSLPRNEWLHNLTPSPNLRGRAGAFDPTYFNLPPREASPLDLQRRLLLHTACASESLPHSKTQVYKSLSKRATPNDGYHQCCCRQSFPWEHDLDHHTLRHFKGVMGQAFVSHDYPFVQRSI